jgi:hypothetical protein
MRGGVAEQLAPVLHRAIRGDERARPLVPTHDDLQEILGRCPWQFPHPEVIDHQERHGLQRRHVFLALAGQRRIGKKTSSC